MPRMPMCYKTPFGKKAAVIIDCFRISIDQPSNLSAHASTWSNYKHHNTAKVLLGLHLRAQSHFFQNAGIVESATNTSLNIAVY